MLEHAVILFSEAILSTSFSYAAHADEDMDMQIETANCDFLPGLHDLLIEECKARRMVTYAHGSKQQAASNG